MELKEFENRVKKSLESRRIVPSAAAWKKMERQLGEEEKKRSMVILWSLSIASLLILGFFVSRSLFTPTPVPSLHVETPTDISVEKGVQLENHSRGLEITRTDENKAYKTGESKTKDAPLVNDKKKALELDRPSSPIEEVNQKRPLLTEGKLERLEGPNQIIENPIPAIELSSTSTSHEADALLAIAKEQIKKNDFKYKTFHPATHATLLLVETENEMEKSLGEKVLFKIKDGVKEAKNLIANTEGFGR